MRGLDGLLARLRTEDVQVDARLDEYEYGRFGCIMDPEGQRIELWEGTGGGDDLLRVTMGSLEHGIRDLDSDPIYR